ncbi:5-bromo-4-chloroindolyl phosphate hydrolysis family protein [Niallia sp. Krafla_26]|uniref:5-bromo-4-chloroindolyl phosphate hydrolysis family protein n=1 Tax=Niallia sp. Krafla_26 TaxID=3064703 RepID=UPI003D16673D
MKSFFQFILRSAAGISITLLVWVFSFFTFDTSFFSSILMGIGGGAIVYLLLGRLFNRQFLKENGITRREFKYIKRNLKEAKEKITRLQKAILRIRNLSDIKQNYEVIRLVNKIYSTTKKEPKRFFKAERFYFTNLDSIVELTEKYALLHSQPAKTPELTISLKETRLMIDKLTDSLENDLYKVLEDDIDDLHFELDVAKKTINRLPEDINNRRQ